MSPCGGRSPGPPGAGRALAAFLAAERPFGFFVSGESLEEGLDLGGGELGLGRGGLTGKCFGEGGCPPLFFGRFGFVGLGGAAFGAFFEFLDAFFGEGDVVFGFGPARMAVEGGLPMGDGAVEIEEGALEGAGAAFGELGFGGGAFSPLKGSVSEDEVAEGKTLGAAPGSSTFGGDFGVLGLLKTKGGEGAVEEEAGGGAVSEGEVFCSEDLVGLDVLTLFKELDPLSKPRWALACEDDQEDSCAEEEGGQSECALHARPPGDLARKKTKRRSPIKAKAWPRRGEPR